MNNTWTAYAKGSAWPCKLATGWAHEQHSRLALYADAYLGIIDSLYVELMYAGPDAYERRAQHC
ncbi:TetR family transcriptional regulator [Pseudomonas putida]|nr:hypothetical protein [Pseudomonas putida]SUD71269.1 TetR family transcriptional regulator [Pseudomonas putida]